MRLSHMQRLFKKKKLTHGFGALDPAPALSSQTQQAHPSSASQVNRHRPVPGAILLKFYAQTGQQPTSQQVSRSWERPLVWQFEPSRCAHTPASQPSAAAPLAPSPGPSPPLPLEFKPLCPETVNACMGSFEPGRDERARLVSQLAFKSQTSLRMPTKVARAPGACGSSFRGHFFGERCQGLIEFQ